MLHEHTRATYTYSIICVSVCFSLNSSVTTGPVVFILGENMPLASGRVLIYFVTLNSKSRSQWRSNWLTQQMLCRFRSYLRYWCPLGSTNTLRILVTLRSKSRSQRSSNWLTQQPLGNLSHIWINGTPWGQVTPCTFWWPWGHGKQIVTYYVCTVM